MALLLSAVFAQAASVKPPPTGPWKLSGGNGGFTLKHGKGRKRNRVFLTTLHGKTQLYSGCPAKATPYRVLGRHALRKFSRGGYTSWGVGKNSGGDVVPMPARVRVGGKTYNGSFYLVWDYSNPRELLGGSVGYRSCLVQFSFGYPK